MDRNTKYALDHVWVTECLILTWLTVLTVTVAVMW